MPPAGCRLWTAIEEFPDNFPDPREFSPTLLGSRLPETGFAGLRPPPTTPGFWRTLRRPWKASKYPGVVAGHSAWPRSLAAFFVVAASLGVLVSGGRINFHGRRKAEAAETGSHWQRRFWLAQDARLREGALRGLVVSFG